MVRTLGDKMSQLYLQRFKYRAGTKSEFDQGWAVANAAMERSGNFGDVKSGVRNIKAYGAGWGGYAILEVSDAAAFARYQHYHMLNYAHLVDITFEPIYDLETVST
jgi:hypothetical protein